jgi:hypothetical protein
MDPMTKAFVADIPCFAARGLELVSFAKGQRKDDLAPARPLRLRTAERAYRSAFDDLARHAHMAA